MPTTEIQQALVAITDAARPRPTAPGSADAGRCGVLLAVLGRIQYAATRTDTAKRLRGAAETPAAVFNEMLIDAGQAHLPKLDQLNQGARHRRALTDATEGLTIPERFTPAQRNAFLLAYHQAVGQFRARTPDEAAAS